jgi:hypothetical protein
MQIRDSSVVVLAMLSIESKGIAISMAVDVESSDSNSPKRMKTILK